MFFRYQFMLAVILPNKTQIAKNRKKNLHRRGLMEQKLTKPS